LQPLSSQSFSALPFVYHTAFPSFLQAAAAQNQHISKKSRMLAHPAFYMEIAQERVSPCTVPFRQSHIGGSSLLLFHYNRFFLCGQQEILLPAKKATKSATS
jgi:hypothetical protein